MNIQFSTDSELNINANRLYRLLTYIYSPKQAYKYVRSYVREKLRERYADAREQADRFNSWYK